VNEFFLENTFENIFLALLKYVHKIRLSFEEVNTLFSTNWKR
jgi:hypothetical protein